MSLPCINIVGIDMSYRHTGFVRIQRTKKAVGVELQLCSATTIDNDVIQLGFDGLQSMATQMRKTVETILCGTSSKDIILIEVPSASQDVKSAITCGMCWMAAKEISLKRSAILIDASVLKLWSASVKGDGKEVVKQKVCSRLRLPSSNDNIIDAAGIALMFSDEITLQQHHERTK